MSVNSNGDYEALAKLLYPSIEASGNVYYGQTRKLTMDEVFDKYKGGFESHIESRRVEDVSSEYGFKYEKYFCWTIGPLSGEFCIDGDGDHHIPMESYPLYYAKYLLNKTIVAEENVLNSGTYNSYHYDIEPKLKKVFYHGGKNPCDDSPWDGKSFYVVKDGDDYYLYVAIINSVSDDANLLPEEYDPDNPITFNVLNNPVNLMLHAMNIDTSPLQSAVDWYEYNINSTNWQSLPITDLASGNSNILNLNVGDSICFRLKQSVTHKSQELNVAFNFYAADSDCRVSVSGDIRSLHVDKHEVQPFEFMTLLTASPIINAMPLKTTSLGVASYRGMMSYCTYLKTAPQLSADILPAYCYSSMFDNCSGLKVAPLLIGTTFEEYADPITEVAGYQQYAGMFKNCTSLKDVCCISGPVGDSHKDWLKNSGVKTIHTSKDSVWNTSDESVVPLGCTIVRDFELEYTYDD